MIDKEFSGEIGNFPAGRVHVLRLRPREDLLESLWRYARVRKTNALTILSIVGSLTKTNIRYANDNFGTSREGHFEIVSAVGNIDRQEPDSDSDKGQGHVHIALADEVGNSFGGHLLRGNIIFTTAEVTMLEVNQALFYRVPDTTSGYNEMKVISTYEENTCGEKKHKQIEKN